MAEGFVFLVHRSFNVTTFLKNLHITQKQTEKIYKKRNLRFLKTRENERKTELFKVRPKVN